MRTLTTVLAILGAIWAIAGIAGWAMAIYALLEIESTLDAAKALVTIILLVSGYFVWWSWVFYSVKERFPIFKPRTFWTICLVHHAACIVYLMPMDVWGGGDDPWWIPAWIIANVMIAVTLLARYPFDDLQPDQQSASSA